MRARSERRIRDVIASALMAEHQVGSATRAAPIVLHNLRDRLGRVIGRVGFDALCRRSLALARTTHPSTTFDDSVFFSAGVPSGGTRESDEFVITVATNIVVLLATFIGEPLTRRVLQEVWPQLAAADANLAREEQESSE
jgi:hypothetical protein